MRQVVLAGAERSVFSLFLPQGMGTIPTPCHIPIAHSSRRGYRWGQLFRFPGVWTRAAWADAPRRSPWCWQSFALSKLPLRWRVFTVRH